MDHPFHRINQRHLLLIGQICLQYKSVGAGHSHSCPLVDAMARTGGPMVEVVCTLWQPFYKNNNDVTFSWYDSESVN